MSRLITLLSTGVLGLSLSACVVEAPSDSNSAGTSGAPTAAEQACLRDVTRTTNNPDVVLIGSEFSQAGTMVRVGVGPDRAPWKCIAYSDGTTAGIEFMGSEGAL